MNRSFSRQNCDARQAWKKYAQSESGQSIILISTVVLSFLFFFQFALNTGLLINAKISVQAAADAAAYAGAATQARQLNAISYLNYDMRRQYKKFLFRYVFVGSMGSPNFPTNSAPNAGSPQYDFPKKNFFQPAQKGDLLALNVPVVCIPLTSGGTPNDNCVSVNLPDTTKSIQDSIGTGGLNSITQALLDNINAIQSRQSELCQGQGDMNLFVLLAWLFRGDVDQKTLSDLLDKLQKAAPGAAPSADNSKKSAAAAIQGLVKGLGLYPRNIINLMRIKTLTQFLNEPHDAQISLEKANAWEKNPNVAEGKERSLQAFHSAIVNLNTDVFDANSLEIQELQADQQFSFHPTTINFNAYIQTLMPKDTSGSPSANGTICNSLIVPFPAVGAPIGIEVNAAQNKVNYAVRVKAFVKPRGILFLPGSDPLELDAVAGAKPFGSRIGPRHLNIADLEKDITPGEVNGKAADCSGDLGCKVPDIDIIPGISSYSIDYLKDLRTKATENNVFTSAGIELAQRYATAPNQKEVGLYNILPPPPQSAGDLNSQFIPYADGPASTVYRFYAPVFPAGSSSVNQELQNFLSQIFPATQVANDNPLHINMADIRSQVLESTSKYINSKLESGKDTENGETLTFAALELPIMAKMTENKGYWLTNAKQVLSSWGPKYGNNGHSSRDFAPRFGYSVKFVTMQNLMKEGVSDDDGDLSKTHH